VFTAAIVVGCGSEAGGPVTPRTSAPVAIAVDPAETWNVGALYVGEQVQREFRVTNVGAVAVRVRRHPGGGGCGSAMATIAACLEPGETVVDRVCLGFAASGPVRATIEYMADAAN
jgi:hypothetical protein